MISMSKGVPRGDPDPPALLWIYASYRCRVGHALNRQGVRGGAHVNPLVHRSVQDLVERARDHMVQLRVDLLLLPEESLEVLHPLEVRHDHATGVREDVRNHEDPTLVKDGVRVGCYGSVRAFGDEAGPNAFRVLTCDLVLDRGWDEHGHRQLQQLGVGHRLSLLETTHAAADLAVLIERGEVKAVGVVNAAS